MELTFPGFSFSAGELQRLAREPRGAVLEGQVRVGELGRGRAQGSG